MAKIIKVVTRDGIDWYCEQQGSGPDLLLIPSGEGDCESFAKVARILASSFTVTTFDMPGMSRTIAPASAFEDFSPKLLANQIVGLMDKLSIEVATVYGCSSGGAAALQLVANHSNRIRGAVVHEVPMDTMEKLIALPTLDDTEILRVCRETFRTVMNENFEAWDALGAEFHTRLDRNYITWARNYIGRISMQLTKKDLTQRPVIWTIGALNPAGMFFGNVITACQAGIPISLLPCKHFPQVSIPEALAEHIRANVGRISTS
ncbi:ZEN-JJM [Xylogone sp. PMI_703]|nr:ZEN-JJM [Xylogone sp. PMI_703]